MENPRVDRIIAEIDGALDSPPVDLQTALAGAVRRGDMTIKEAEQCLQAYKQGYEGTQSLEAPTP